jgi:lipopolysaccharide heptosyltransferase II
VKGRLRTAILALIRLLGLPGLLLARRRVRAQPRVPRILVLRPDHLGDLILTTPALTALRAHLPEAQITCFVGPWSRAVVERHPGVDQVMTCAFPGFRRAPQGALAPYWLLLRLAAQLRRERYDLAINLRPDFWWGAALLYLSAIPQRIGYALPPGAAFLSEALPLPAGEHSTRSSLRLVSAALQCLGQSPLTEPLTPERYPLVCPATAQEEQQAAEYLAAAGLSDDSAFAVIHPGSGAAVKLWRSAAWATCAEVLMHEHGLRIVLTGTPQERSLLEEIALQIQRSNRLMAAPLLLSELSVGELASVLRRARLVLGVDSGPLHLAVAQGTPTIALYGPADPCIFGPWGWESRHLVVAATQRCPACPRIPCGRLDIAPEALEVHPCVRLIPETAVIEAITRLAETLHVVE